MSEKLPHIALLEGITDEELLDSPKKTKLEKLVGRGNDNLVGFPAKIEPWHRQAALMHVMGRTYVEIGRQLNKSTVAVGNFLKSPKGKQLADGFEGSLERTLLSQMVAAEAIQSVSVLASLRDDEKVPASVRASSAKTLLEKAFGNQGLVQEEPERFSNPQEELRAIEAEIEQMSKKDTA